MKFDYDNYCQSLGGYLKLEYDKYIIFSKDGFDFKLYKVKIRNSNIKPSVSNCLDKVNYFRHIMKDHPKKNLSFDKYVFGGIKEKSVVTCLEHGDFLADAYRLINLNSGCDKCFKKYHIGESRRKSNEKFIEEGKLRFGDFIDYSLVDYKNTMSKVKLICPIHGVFEQSPNEHLKSITGCSFCGKELASGYSLSDYERVCPSGSNLYVIKLMQNGDVFYKIGISKNTRKRFKHLEKEGLKCVDGMIYRFDDAGLAWCVEKDLHRNLKYCKYTPKLKFSGYTECFSCDKIDLDYVDKFINTMRGCVYDDDF